MSNPSPQESKLRRAHPLATALTQRLHAQPGARVLEFGSGSGRNSAALAAAGYAVHSVDGVANLVLAPHAFDAAISTHALLHGTPGEIARALAEISRALCAQAPLYATFGSKKDARYGRGTRIDDDTFAPDEGDEIGVPHAFFDEGPLRAMLAAHFVVESLEERDVDAIVGSWAHALRPTGSVHWFAHVRRR